MNRLDKRKARSVIRNTIVALGGPKLANRRLILANNPRGVSTAIFSTRTGKLLYLGISPPTYWQKDEERLIALVGHEYVNGFFLNFTKEERDYAQALAEVYRKKRTGSLQQVQAQLEVKNYFELNTAVLLHQLVRKLKVDEKTIGLLKRYKLPTGGYIKFLETELAETRHIKPPRRYLHILAILLRIEHAKSLLHGEKGGEVLTLISRLKHIVRSH